MGTEENVINVPEMKDVDLAFGNVSHLPKWEDIPKEFKEEKTKWNRLFSTIFYGGLKGTLTPKPGVDYKKAGRAIRAIMVSWEPKHEHKEAGCAYLMSQWFEDWSEDDRGDSKADPGAQPDDVSRTGD